MRKFLFVVPVSENFKPLLTNTDATLQQVCINGQHRDITSWVYLLLIYNPIPLSRPAAFVWTAKQLEIRRSATGTALNAPKQRFVTLLWLTYCYRNSSKLRSKVHVYDFYSVICLQELRQSGLCVETGWMLTCRSMKWRTWPNFWFQMLFMRFQIIFYAYSEMWKSCLEWEQQMFFEIVSVEKTWNIITKLCSYEALVKLVRLLTILWECERNERLWSSVLE